ncbi:MAG: aspartate aminotransferase family protein [Bacteroidetes bacterium]|nr:MAG: aspartate aminotransferase family protein [Bacteroidota bacterium]
MNNEEFRRQAHQFVDWMADYLATVEDYPVRAQVQPGDVRDQLPAAAPERGEAMDDIFRDFQEIILPGMTHWQSPHFFAYFPANGSYPSLLAEMLTATLGAQCMIWETSPAAAELEEQVMKWLGQLIGIPDSWSGVIQSTASDATLVALLTARERASDFQYNAQGGASQPRYRVYGSAELHSSIEKAVKIAGLGRENYVKIPVDEHFAMRPEALAVAIHDDRMNGYTPLAVVAALGTTSSTAVDPISLIADICTEEDLWLHIDAAYAGSALILPQYRDLIRGIEQADSFVFNPHKWLFTHFDCSAYFVRNHGHLIRTFEISPEYLKTQADAQVNNYRDWGVPLGRRFRALKLWFVLRSFGAEGLRQRLQHHIDLAQGLVREIDAHPDFERLAPAPFNLICFRYHPRGLDDPATLDALNARLLAELNASGQLYLTHTRLAGNYVMRLVIGQTEVQQRHVDAAWERIQKTAANLEQA